MVPEIHLPRTAPLVSSGERINWIASHKTKLSQHPDKEARLWDLLGQKQDWPGEIVAGATLDDLDPKAIAAARKHFQEYLVESEPDGDRHEQIKKDVDGWDVPTLLNKLRITKQGRITRSALLLLGRDEAAHFLAPVDAKMTWVLRESENRTAADSHWPKRLVPMFPK